MHVAPRNRAYTRTMMSKFIRSGKTQNLLPVQKTNNASGTENTEPGNTRHMYSFFRVFLSPRTTRLDCGSLSPLYSDGCEATRLNDAAKTHVSDTSQPSVLSFCVRWYSLHVSNKLAGFTMLNIQKQSFILSQTFTFLRQNYENVSEPHQRSPYQHIT